MAVRTRFAPSPTGFLHVGGVRTALFSWLYAKRNQGVFVLRVEDTDSLRSTKESTQAILDGMHWLGLQADEGPFYQTERYERYREVARQLFDSKNAYCCTCSKERLEELRTQQLETKQKPRYDGHCRNKNLSFDEPNSVLRFKNPCDGLVSFDDAVYGQITVDNAELDDFVIMRSDGHPTYNFAVVVDDIDMEITHVIRGDDHINNTPRQINLYNALEIAIPVFAHLPMILGEDGKRLSKRHGAVSVLQFEDMGILPQALLNYLVRLGWSSGDTEIFSIDEMIERFDFNGVNRAPASFNYDKLYWLNQHYIKSLPANEVALVLQKHFDKNKVITKQGPRLESIVEIQADRCKTLEQMYQKSLYFYQENIEYDVDAVEKFLTTSNAETLGALYTALTTLPVWDAAEIQTAIKSVCEQFGIKFPKLAQPLRVAVTGGTDSPSIDMTVALIGKDRTLKRMHQAIVKIKEIKEL